MNIFSPAGSVEGTPHCRRSGLIAVEDDLAAADASHTHLNLSPIRI